QKSVDGSQTSGRIPVTTTSAEASPGCPRSPRSAGTTGTAASSSGPGVGNLGFIAPTQIHSAVFALGNVEFHVKLEIIERLGCPEVGASPFVGDFSVLRNPVAARILLAHEGVGDGLPSGQVLSVEQGHGIRPGLRRRALQCRRTGPGDFGNVLTGRLCARELAAFDGEIPGALRTGFGTR